MAAHATPPQSLARRVGNAASRIGGRQHDYGYDAIRTPLVSGQLRKSLSMRPEKALALLARRLTCNDIERRIVDLDRDVGLCRQVVIPAWVVLRAAVRGDHDVTT